jgi:regulator of replication initiation timing
MTDPSAESSSASPAGESSGDQPLSPPVEPIPVSVYLLVEPVVRGKKILDIASAGGPGVEYLRRAGAAAVIACLPTGPSLPISDAEMDVVLCGLSLYVVRSDEERAAWLKEIRRVLHPEGLCVLRLASAALREDAQSGAGVRAACTDFLLTHFATVDMVDETPFSGVSFHVAGTEDLAVNESLTRLSGAASHLVAFCADSLERPWTLSESLLVPTDVGHEPEGGISTGELTAWQAEVARVEARCADLAHERDSAREGAMTLQDRADRLERTAAALRKEIERTLRQVSDNAAARELLALERDDLRRKLAEATQKAADAEHELERRQGALRALEKEVVRLRAARGGGR